MVYITDEDGTVRKFACLTCIKGHRSSGCQHADRELVEIRKKGRPVSQCAHCRNLRKTKQVHIKCLCHKKSEVLSTLSPNSSPSPPPPLPVTSSTATSTTSSASLLTSTTLSDGKHVDFMHHDLQPQNLLSKSCARCDRSPSYCICTFESRANHADYGYLSSGSSDGTVTPPTTGITTLSSPLATNEQQQQQQQQQQHQHHHHHHHHYQHISTTTTTTTTTPVSSSPPSSPSSPMSLSSSSHHEPSSLRLVIPSQELENQHHSSDQPLAVTVSSPMSYEVQHSSSRQASPFGTPPPSSSSTTTIHYSKQQRTLPSPAGLQTIIPIHDPTDDLDSDTPVYKSAEQTIDQSEVLGELTNRTSEELMNQIYNEFSAETFQLSHPPVDFATDESDYHQEHHHHHSTTTSPTHSYRLQKPPVSDCHEQQQQQQQQKCSATSSTCSTSS